VTPTGAWDATQGSEGDKRAPHSAHGPGWGGSGDFEDGESEDYLVQIDATIGVDAETWGQIKSIYR
jgi:hypothetical protein